MAKMHGHSNHTADATLLIINWHLFKCDSFGWPSYWVISFYHELGVNFCKCEEIHKKCLQFKKHTAYSLIQSIYPSWEGGTVLIKIHLLSVCWCYPSFFWGYITLCNALVLALNAYAGWYVHCKLLGLRSGLPVWKALMLVKFFEIVFNMFYMSAILFLIANVEIPCKPCRYYGKCPTNNGHIVSLAIPSHLSWTSNCLAAAPAWPYCTDGR